MYRERSRSPVSKGGQRRDNYSNMNTSDADMSNGSMNNSGMAGMQNSGMNVPQGMNMNQMQQMNAMNNMYQQGNLLMGAMYPNMMMGGHMMGGMPQGGGMMPQGGGMMPQVGGMMPQGSNMMPQGGAMMPQGGALMPPTGIDMVSSSSMDMMNQSNTEMMSQPNMDMSSMTPQSTQQQPAASMEMMSGMMMDPTMMGMNMYPNMPTNMDTTMENAMPRPELKEIVLKNVTLTPPSPNRPLPPRRIKPPGCRTIFVGGLPDKIRESMVRDIFERYGRIITLRLSKKNFCHIRFDRESCVDEAIWLSGYSIKITEKSSKDKEDKEETKDDTGYLHVDYALSRDDQNEYERRQRQALRAQEEEMQKMQMSSGYNNMGSSHTSHISHNTSSNPRKSRFRSPSPPRVMPYSSTTVPQIAEKLKMEDQFASVLPTLLTWLERGECSKKNANQFYSMIQVANSHIRRLFNEKMQAEDEFQEYKERMKNNIAKIIEQLEQVGKVFNAATHQRVWDHFTKPQRKNIETWQKMAQEFTNLKEEFLEKFSDDDFVAPPKPPVHDNQDELLQLKRENESLEFQLEAYKNEVDVIKADAQKEMEKFKAHYIASQALRSARENPPLPTKPAAERPPPPPPLPTDIILKVELGEAKLIGIIASFLQVHPQGASLDYVVSYVRALSPGVTHTQVHQVLQKHDDAFQLRSTGVGAGIDNRWHFTAFRDFTA